MEWFRYTDSENRSSQSIHGLDELFIVSDLFQCQDIEDHGEQRHDQADTVAFDPEIRVAEQVGDRQADQTEYEQVIHPADTDLKFPVCSKNL